MGVSKDQVEVGRELLIKLLTVEGKYDEFMRLLRKGKFKEAQDMAEAVVAKYRNKFNDEMGVTGGA